MYLRGCFILLVLCVFHSVVANDSLRLSGQRPRVGLVLSGGGAKGIAHVGALKVIEESGIPIDYIGGTSMGSIVGGLYALGYTANQLEIFVTESAWDVLLSDRILRRHVSIYEKDELKRYWLQFPIKGRKIELPRSILTGQNISNLFVELASPAYSEGDFSKFPTPFLCVATDIESGTEVVIEYGNLAKAMRASMAIPSLFTPVEIYGRKLYDGGLINNFPANEVKKKGMDIIIGVDVSAQPTGENDLNNIFKVMEQTVFMASLPLKETNKKLCQVLIIPDIPEYNASSFDSADSLMVRGERAARKQFDALKAIADSLRRFEPDEPKEHSLCPQPLQSFYVQRIKINGLKRISTEYVLQKLELDTLTEVTFQQLNRGLERLKGAQTFESVVYQINPISNSAVEIQFDCIERSTSFFKIGLNYDNDYKASLLMNLTFRNVLLNNSKASADISIGQNPVVSLSFFQSPSLKPVGKTLFKSVATPDWLFQITGNKFDAYKYSGNKRIVAYSFSSLTSSIDLLLSPSINSVLGGGLIFDYVVINNKVGNMEQSFKSNYMYLTYRAFYERDTYNESYFPTSGNMFRLEGLYSKGISKEARYTDGSFGVLFRSNFTYSPGKRWTLHSGIDAGSMFGKDIPPQYMMHLGGIPGKQLRNHFRFVGMHFLQKEGENAWVAHLNSQVRLWSNIFVVFRTNLGKIEPELTDLFTLQNYWFGYGVSAQYNSIIGPLGLTFSASNATNGLITSINIGFWF